MKILLIDADGTVPNLALMRLSAYHKKQKDTVDFVRLGLSFYPSRTKKEYVPISGYDSIYCSVLFENNHQLVKDALDCRVTKGGTGFSLKTTLPQEVELCEPDYDIYPQNVISYGFITRGCIRKCSFCKVPEKEGNIRQVASPLDIIRHNKVVFMDNNILSFPAHYEVFNELIKLGVRCQFNQGLDIRLLNAENSFLLGKLPYFGEYTFALDELHHLDVVERSLPMLSWRKPWSIRFFVYANPYQGTHSVVKRIKWLRQNKCLAYVMRDVVCYADENADFYTDIASWCNQPSLFKSMPFDYFLQKRHEHSPSKKQRIQKTLSLFGA